LFENGEARETFSTLVNPGRPIPERVSAITGIQTDDLIGAPGIHAVLPALHAFIGDRPVLGHKVDFDLGFLARFGIATENLALDTYELASVLLPDTARYNLTHLSDQLDVSLEHAHRALDDALATGHLYWELWQRALALPLEILQEIVEAAGDLPWSAQPVFLAALQERSKTAFTEDARERKRTSPAPTDLFKPADRAWQPLRPNPSIQPLDVDGAASIIEQGGELARVFAGYEDRPQQVEMLRTVAQAFNREEHLIIEAATGVGKSLGYLIPAVLWAVQNNERVV